MKDHRVRLDDHELALVVSALKARAAGLHSEDNRRAVKRLAERLEECSPGNPWMILGWLECYPGAELPARPQHQEEASH